MYLPSGSDFAGMSSWFQRSDGSAIPAPITTITFRLYGRLVGVQSQHLPIGNATDTVLRSMVLGLSLVLSDLVGGRSLANSQVHWQRDGGA